MSAEYNLCLQRGNYQNSYDEVGVVKFAVSTVNNEYVWELRIDNFVDDMGVRPEGLTLERIDVDGNYEPGNVTWATYLEQANNRRQKEDAGLHFFKRKQTWQVTIGLFGKTVYLGSSKTKNGAIKIRKAGETIKNLLIDLGVYKDEHIDV